MSRLRTLIPVLTATLLALITFALPASTPQASAHPLGNFSINRLSILEVGAIDSVTTDGTVTGEVRITYIVDMAEIPTFQSRSAIDPNEDGLLSPTEADAYLDEITPRLLANLNLEIAGEAVPFEVLSNEAELLPGQGGLNTSRVLIEARADLLEGWQGETGAAYTDSNFEGTNGWRQVVVRPGDGAALFATSAPIDDVTAGLTRYPEDLLKSAPAVTSASFQFGAGGGATVALTAPAATGNTVARDEANKTLGRFASLIAADSLTPAVIVVALALSVVWGAMHALGPGHGKTVVAAYLVGERGTGRHAVYLGLLVTATHTISVFALGAIAILASDVIATDDIYFWLSLGSGVVVAILGGLLLYSRSRRLIAARSAQPHHDHHDHDAHDHPHDHEHAHHNAHDHGAHGHSHVPTQPGFRGIVALGVAGGIVPCPTALVVMLGAIALDRAVLGMVMVTAFSLGLAAVLTGIGLLMVYGKRWLESRTPRFVTAGVLRRAQLVAPVLSALAILGVGVVLTGQAVL